MPSWAGYSPSEPDEPLSNLLRSAAGTCLFYNQQAGILSRKHSQCRQSYDTGFQEMVNVAA